MHLSIFDCFLTNKVKVNFVNDRCMTLSTKFYPLTMTSDQSVRFCLISSILIWFSNIYLFLKVLTCTPRKLHFWAIFEYLRNCQAHWLPKVSDMSWFIYLTSFWHDVVTNAPHQWYFTTFPMKERQRFFFGLLLNIFPIWLTLRSPNQSN